MKSSKFVIAFLVASTLVAACKPAGTEPAPQVAPSANELVNGEPSAVAQSSSTARPSTVGDAVYDSDALAGHLSSASVGPHQAMRQAAPAEAEFIDRTGMRAEQIQKLMQSRDFESLLERMLHESDSDSLAMTKLYHESLLKSLAKDKRFALSQLACGARVCAAIVNSPIEDEVAFAEMIMNPADGSKMYLAVMHLMPAGDGRQTPQYRIVFSTDPSLNYLPADARR
jgi:hypothetical protein